MAKTTQTICISLEPKYINILQKIKEKQKRESLSDTFRFLLNWYQEKLVQTELEKAYKEYYSDPKNIQRERQLTEEMLGLGRVNKRGAR